MHGASVVGKDHKKEEFRSKVKISAASALVLGGCFAAYVPLHDHYVRDPLHQKYELVDSARETISSYSRSLDSDPFGSDQRPDPQKLSAARKNLNLAGYSELANRVATCTSIPSSRTQGDCLGEVSTSLAQVERTELKKPFELDTLCSIFLKAIAPVAALFLLFGVAGLISDRIPSKPSEKYKSKLNSEGA